MLTVPLRDDAHSDCISLGYVRSLQYYYLHQPVQFYMYGRLLALPIVPVFLSTVIMLL
jgi:hypothetical protein